MPEKRILEQDDNDGEELFEKVILENKPAGDNDDEEDDDDDDVGPMLPTENDRPDQTVRPVKKRRKVILNARKYFDDLPQIERYARSYMHRDTVCAVNVALRTNFVITASTDGFVKFWKKMSKGIEFVKQFRAHLGAVDAIAASIDGTLYVSACSAEKTIKSFDVVNFDLFTMLQLTFTPKALCWVHREGHGEALLAVSDADSGNIRIYDLRTGDTEPIRTIENVHSRPVILMSYNARYHCVVSCDELGNIEYWTPDGDLSKPEECFELKSSTDLYEFRKSKSCPTCLTFSPDFESLATTSFPDREVRIFKFRTGKIIRKYDESLGSIETMHSADTSIVQLDDIEFGRRLAIEREMERTTDALKGSNVIYDESGLFIMYSTMLGVKLINTNSNACVKIFGRSEKLRMINLALYQGAPKKARTTTLAMAASDNPLIAESLLRDPTLFVTSYQKNRFYMFTSQELKDSKLDRDALNEKPTAEEIAASQEPQAAIQTGNGAMLHTSAGDIKLILFPKKAPKAVENFVTHAKNGYYDGTIFHRVIKQFMIQGGDPDGNGTGGTSIWNREFEDEFTDLKHDRYTLSMANAGPNTNGSQFFITTAETYHLDGKHTVFGRVQAGFEIVHKIENAPVGKLDRPRDPVHIHSIDIII